MKRKTVTASLSAAAPAVGFALTPALAAQADQTVPSSPGYASGCSPDGEVYIASFTNGDGDVQHAYRKTDSDAWQYSVFLSVTPAYEEVTYTGYRAAHWQAYTTSTFSSADADCVN